MVLDILKRKKAEHDTDKKMKSVLSSMALFRNNESYNIFRIIDHLKTFWKLTIENDEDVDNEVAVFKINKQTIVIASVPVPLPENEWTEVTDYCYTWQNVKSDMENHTNHVVITVVDPCPFKVEWSLIISKVLCSILMTTNCIGVYQPNQMLLLSRDYYLEFLEDIHNDVALIPLWMYIGMVKGDKGMSIFTYGMDIFDKHEIEIINSKKEIDDLYNFILNISAYVVGNDINLKHGETIGYFDVHKAPVKLSDGVFIKNKKTLKISL